MHVIRTAGTFPDDNIAQHHSELAVQFISLPQTVASKWQAGW